MPTRCSAAARFMIIGTHKTNNLSHFDLSAADLKVLDQQSTDLGRGRVCTVELPQLSAVRGLNKPLDVSLHAVVYTKPGIGSSTREFHVDRTS